MNEKLEQMLLSVIEKGIEIAEKTGQFAIDMAPELLREFYLWHISKNVVEILIYLSVFIALRRVHILFSYKNQPEEGKFIFRRNRYFRQSWSDGTSNDLAACTIIKALSHTLFIPVFICIYDIVYISVAPKIYLINHFIN